MTKSSTNNIPSRPQSNIFEIVIFLKKISSILFYAIFIISLLLPFISKDCKINEVEVLSILGIINFVLIISFAGLSFVIDYIFFPKAENIRRADYIDNSFGSNHNIHESKDYFSNDTANYGIYKAAVNLFENCLFSLKISSKMLLWEVIKSIIIAIVIIILAVQGFQNSQIALPILQLFLSASILGELIKLIMYVSKMESSFNDLKNLFSEDNFKKNPENYIHLYLRYYSNYESALARSSILLNSKIYKELNPSLSKEWEEIKTKLNI
ncbi:MAG: hypothetical protein ACRBFS_03450 [Aureispira sp.]